LKTSLCSHVSTLLNYDKDASSSACEFLVNVFVEEGPTKERERERERVKQMNTKHIVTVVTPLFCMFSTFTNLEKKF